MMQRSRGKSGLVLFIHVILVLALIAIHCEKKKTETTHELKPGETMPLPKVDFKVLNAQIDSIQTIIQQNPTQLEPRMQLLSLAVDTQAQVIRAVGHGLPPTNARNPVMGRQAAERAAIIDAARWTAYIISWMKNLESADYGSIEAMVPGGRILESRETDSGEIIIFAETPIPALP